MKSTIKKNIVIIIIAAVLAVGAGVGAVAIGISNSPANRVSRYMGAAERYLSELDYEQAIIEFDRILEIDPMNVEAYLGKAQAYLALGDTENALKWLEKGLEMTGDEKLRDKIDEINSESESSGESGTSEPEESEPEVTSVTILGVEYYVATTTALDFSDKNITDDVLKEIAPQLEQLTNLEILFLERNPISDISPLANLTNLTFLAADGTRQISDISPLANLTNLTELYLSGNQITDISPLANLTNLTMLVLSDNQISDADKDRLRQQLPNCEIIF